MKHFYKTAITLLVTPLIWACKDVPNIENDFGNEAEAELHYSAIRNSNINDLGLTYQIDYGNNCYVTDNVVNLSWDNVLEHNTEWRIDRVDSEGKVLIHEEVDSGTFSFQDEGSDNTFSYYLSTTFQYDSTLKYRDTVQVVNYARYLYQFPGLMGWSDFGAPIDAGECSGDRIGQMNIERMGDWLVAFFKDGGGIGVYVKSADDINDEWELISYPEGIVSASIFKVSDNKIMLFAGRNIVFNQAYQPISEYVNYVFDVSLMDWVKVAGFNENGAENKFTNGTHFHSLMEDGRTVITSYGYVNNSSDKYDRTMNQTIVSIIDPADNSFNYFTIENSKVTYISSYVGDGMLVGFVARVNFINGSGGCDPCFGIRTEYDELKIISLEEKDYVETIGIEVLKNFPDYIGYQIQSFEYNGDQKVITAFPEGNYLIYNYTKDTVEVEYSKFPQFDSFTNYRIFKKGKELYGVISGVYFSEDDRATIYKFNRANNQWIEIETTPFVTNFLEPFSYQEDEMVLQVEKYIFKKSIDELGK